jgi:hypothetical protein
MRFAIERQPGGSNRVTEPSAETINSERSVVLGIHDPDAGEIGKDKSLIAATGRLKLNGMLIFRVPEVQFLKGEGHDVYGTGRTSGRCDNPGSWQKELCLDPITVEETAPCFIVRDANKQALAFVYCEDEPGRRAHGQAAHP